MTNAISIRKVTGAIEPVAFSNCLTAIATNLAQVGVETNPAMDVNGLMTAWARHIAEDAEFSMDIFDMSYKGIKTAQDANQAMKLQQDIHRKLTGRKNWKQILHLAKSNDQFIAAITAHPFYKEFQAEGVVAADKSIGEAWRTFQAVDRKVKEVIGKLENISSNLADVTEWHTALDDVAGNYSTPDTVKENVGKLTEALKARQPKLYNSPHAVAALAEVAAKQLYASWAQALTLLDTALSRYYMLLYVGLMMDTAIKLKIAGQTARLINDSASRQLTEMVMLVNELVANPE